MEVVDGGGTRISKIEAIVEQCPLGIHDISRTELDAASNLPRFNMPFELGLYLGAKRYGGAPHNRKKCLILDREPYRYQAYISDIAGQDISSHDNDILTLTSRVRTFLNSSVRGNPLPSGEMILGDFEAFHAILPGLRIAFELGDRPLDYADFVWCVADYLSE